jgi:hypothetical protein
MGQFAGTAFGIGTPTIYPVAQNPWGFSPYASQAFGGQLSSPSIGASYGGAPSGIGAVSPLQQIAQLLQIVPQQLQQLQLLQQQQLVHLEQLLQLVPAQLQQLQQLIQVAPQQIQQLQQQHQQPFAAGLSSPLGFGSVPQAFGGQATGHVM